MKRILSCFAITLLLTPFIGRAQDKEDLINWSAERKLTWNDYKARPNPASDAAASTATHLAIEYNIRDTAFTYRIRSTFSKTRSWGLHKNDYILAHEQGHFDIAEIFAREFNKQLKEYKFNKKSYRSDLKKIYDNILAGKQAMQNTYDEETNHSIKKREQTEWLVKIAKMLDGLEPYADYNQ